MRKHHALLTGLAALSVVAVVAVVAASPSFHGRVAPAVAEAAAPAVRHAAANAISPVQTPLHVGETVTVSGDVATVAVSGRGNAFLNYERAYPDQLFSVVWFHPTDEQVAALRSLSEHKVQVTGTVTTYKGKPQIVVTALDQLALAD
jgi:hypothetical protein